MAYVFVLMTAVIAGAISGVIGTGSSLLLLPLLVQAFGPLEAMPIMAIAAVLGNVSRVVVWWKRVDWRAAGAYAVTGVPAAALGAPARERCWRCRPGPSMRPWGCSSGC